MVIASYLIIKKMLAMLAELLTEYRGLVIVLFVLPGGYIFDAVISLVGWFTKLLGKGYSSHSEKVCLSRSLSSLPYCACCLPASWVLEHAQFRICRSRVRE